MLDKGLLYIWALSSIVLCGFVFSSKIFSFMDDDRFDIGRYSNMDGLRYVLASLVVFHHADYYLNYIIDGKWTTNSTFILYIGKLGVSLFFSITAFLFWGKIKKDNSVDWLNLYKDRLFRIAPLAIIASLLAIIVILFISGFPSNNSLTFSSVVKWLDAGIFNEKPDINGLKRSTIAIAGVTWTLRWEWGFYFCLPILFLFRRKSMEFAIAFMFICLYFMPTFTNASYWIFSGFACGILAKELSDRLSITISTANYLLIGALLAICLLKPGINSVKLPPLTLLIMLSIAKGADLFGLLKMKGFVRLGECSYSIYLLQGIILFPSFIALNNYLHKGNDIQTMMIISIMFFCLTAFSIFTFLLIEKPFIKIGKKIKL